MSDAHFRVPVPVNEPVRSYAPGSPERDRLKQKLASMSGEKVEIPNIIGGKSVQTQTRRQVVQPHAHHEVLGDYSWAGVSELQAAAAAALAAKPAWEAMAWQERAAIFLRAAELISGPYREVLNAATMLGQSKNANQAEIDSACELTDFLRFNASFYAKILEEQPISSPGYWNRSDYRPLEGFVLAITPFNFTAIAGNLPASAAMLGNTVVWKPSDTQMLAAHYTYKIFKEAGLPDGVINLVAADGVVTSQALITHPQLAGVHFTGSTATFRSIWQQVGQSIGNYRSYPRLVGETGGKDFVFAHESADPDALVAALVRGAFEYQGQKCSAASRAYIPRSLWKKIQEKFLAEVATLKLGDVRDFRNFVNAVIDLRSAQRISGHLEHARKTTDSKIIAGGQVHLEKGYFIEPTVILTENPRCKSMVEEIFGPVLTVFVYEDQAFEETLTLCDETSPYALTGAVFARDREVIEIIQRRLRHSAGNFYINDKPTGAVVGQQPFGGARASGTNDKAGSALNLLRWLSARTIKETLAPPADYRYPFLGAE